jgi:hypothetical protein
MSLVALAKADIQRITSNQNGWGVSLAFTAPSGETATITGTHSKHHLGTDTDGNRVNVKNASAAFSEQLLNDLAYPVRNSDGEVYLPGHKLYVKDSTGFEKSYVIREWYPDETVGFIVVILGDI